MQSLVKLSYRCQLTIKTVFHDHQPYVVKVITYQLLAMCFNPEHPKVMRCESMSSTVAQCPVAPTHRCQLTIKTVLQHLSWLIA